MSSILFYLLFFYPVLFLVPCSIFLSYQPEWEKQNRENRAFFLRGALYILGTVKTCIMGSQMGVSFSSSVFCGRTCFGQSPKKLEFFVQTVSRRAEVRALYLLSRLRRPRENQLLRLLGNLSPFPVCFRLYLAENECSCLSERPHSLVLFFHCFIFFLVFDHPRPPLLVCFCGRFGH